MVNRKSLDYRSQLLKEEIEIIPRVAFRFVRTTVTFNHCSKDRTRKREGEKHILSTLS